MLAEHVERFNEAVRSGDYGPMLAAFAPDAEMRFEGAPGRAVRRPGSDRGGLCGRSRPTTRSCCSRSHGSRETRRSPTTPGSREGTRAGRMILTSREGQISRLVVTFE